MRFCEQSEEAFRFIAGVDEAGRGPLAGNVVAAAVILKPDRLIPGLRDSKKISPGKREQLALEIKQHAAAYAIAEADVSEIDSLNILQASLLAMRRAVTALNVSPDFIYVDGNHNTDWPCLSRALVKGDDRIHAIAAASILAKVYRDNSLRLLHESYPQYGFDRHKGYPTAEHLDALRKYGVSPVHRRSFAPVRALLDPE